MVITRFKIQDGGRELKIKDVKQSDDGTYIVNYKQNGIIKGL